MKSPSLWKQIYDENGAFVGQFLDENSFDKAGLTEADARLVIKKRGENKLHGITYANNQWQARFSINGKQEILFSSYSLAVSALMRDLLLSMLTRYPHCAPTYAKYFDPKKEDAFFNLPLNVRLPYHRPCAGMHGVVVTFLERVEKLLLDKGILYPITPEEAAARAQIELQSSKQANTSAQLRYQKRRSTQLDQVLEQISAFGETASKMDELRARLFDWMDRKDAAHEHISQQIEFMTGEFESLKLAVGELTATFRKLIDEARARQ